MFLSLGRQLRAGRGRRLDQSERVFIHWAMTRAHAPATADVLAAAFGVHVSSIYRAHAEVAAYVKADAEWRAQVEANRRAAATRSTMHVAHAAGGAM